MPPRNSRRLERWRESRQRRLKRVRLIRRGRQLSGLHHYAAFLKILGPAKHHYNNRYTTAWGRWCLRHQCYPGEMNSKHRVEVLARGILIRIAQHRPAIHFLPGQRSMPPFTMEQPPPDLELT